MQVGVLSDQLARVRVVQIGHVDRRRVLPLHLALVQQQVLALDVVHAAESARRCRPASSPARPRSRGVLSMSSSSSSGSRAGRSNLLTKVRIGSRWRRQTSNSLRVCPSTPFAASITMTDAVGGNQRAVGVLAEVLVAGRVEQRHAPALEFELERGGG